MDVYVKGTESGSEPLTSDEAKEHLNIVGADKDPEVLALITRARIMFQNRGGRNVLISTTYTLKMDTWQEGDVIYLDRWPVTAVATVKYYDSTNTLIDTMAEGTDFRSDLSGGRIEMINKPALKDRLNAVEVAFTAGYTSTTVPKDLKSTLLLMIADLFVNREDMAREKITAVDKMHHLHSRYQF